MAHSHDSSTSAISMTAILEFSAAPVMMMYPASTQTANTVATATIPIGRIVAKVKLGTITIDPEAGHDRSKFVFKM